MNLYKLFSKKESIAGIEFTADAVRLALFDMNDRKERVLSVLCEEKLSPDIIAEGMVKDQDKLGDALRALLAQSTIPVEYVVASIPPDQVYAKIFSFPKNLPKEKLEEAIALKVDFQMPQNKEAAYIDWEEVPSKEHGEFFVASISKAVVEEYSICLSRAGIKPIAIEFQPLSLLRTLDLPSERTAFIALTTRAHTAVFIVRDKILLFMRIIPRTAVPERSEEAELKEIADYYQSAFGPIEEAYDTDSFTLRPELIALDARLEKDDGRKWGGVLGAALRGLEPRSEDRSVSFMPIGTEQAYQYQRAASYARLLSNLTIGLSLFSVIMLSASWIFVFILAQQNLNRINILTPTIHTEVTKLEERGASLERLFSTDSGMIMTLPSWSSVLETLLPITQENIIINALTVESPEAPITLSGTAKTRVELNAFKHRIEESGIAASVTLPLNNLELKQNIPFTLSFTLIHPERLYQYENTPSAIAL